MPTIDLGGCLRGAGDEIRSQRLLRLELPRLARPAVSPRLLSSRRWLAYYAQHFGTVEVNATFYRLATRAAVERWVDQTPEDFCFAVKASRYMTHVKRLRGISEALRRFYDPLTPLSRQAGWAWFSGSCRRTSTATSRPSKACSTNSRPGATRSSCATPAGSSGPFTRCCGGARRRTGRGRSPPASLPGRPGVRRLALRPFSLRCARTTR